MIDVHVIIIGGCIAAIAAMFAVPRLSKGRRSSKLLPSKKKTNLTSYDNRFDTETHVNIQKYLRNNRYK